MSSTHHKLDALSRLIDEDASEFGAFHVKTIIAGAGPWFASGAFLFAVSAQTKEIYPENEGLVGFLAFFGVFVGNVIAMVGDKFGRKGLITASYATTVVFSFIFCLVFLEPRSKSPSSTPGALGHVLQHSDYLETNKALGLLVVFAHSLACGLGQPAFNALGGEICATNLRAHIMCAGQIVFCLGELVAYGGLLHFGSGGQK